MSQIDDLRREIRDLQSRVANVPLRTAGSGADSDRCPTVKTLPAIPTSGRARVFWASGTTLTGATGDDQVWEAHAEQSVWYPQDKPTNKLGTPPA